MCVCVCENRCQLSLMWTLLIIFSREFKGLVIFPSNPLSFSFSTSHFQSLSLFAVLSLSCYIYLSLILLLSSVTDFRLRSLCSQSVFIFALSLFVLIDCYQDLLGCFGQHMHTHTHTHTRTQADDSQPITERLGECDSESLSIWE